MAGTRPAAALGSPGADAEMRRTVWLMFACQALMNASVVGQVAMSALIGHSLASDKALALERMRQAGAVIVSREMVAFEWMERAGTELFKSISREFIR